VSREREYPIGAGVTLEELDRDPHPVLARLRAHEPVSWLPALDGWLITRYDLALEAMRDAATFTVDDDRFSTAQVVGPSMLSLDGDEHARHRAPFVPAFRPRAVSERFANETDRESQRLIENLRAAGSAAELRRGFAGPLAASIVSRALGLCPGDTPRVLAWYDSIVGGVNSITAGAGITAESRQGFDALRDRLQAVIDHGDGSSLLASAARAADLLDAQLISDAAVLLFGGIETTEGMIANAGLHLLERRDELARVRAEPGLLDGAIEESLRLEPAAAVIDRYATRDVELGGVAIGSRELVRISIAAANRDPDVFVDPDRFDLRRAGARRHLAFAHGPHVCLGIHLARLEARIGLSTLLARLPKLRLDPERPSTVRGLVFRKPPALNVLWS
jgi:cytochrome P450